MIVTQATNILGPGEIESRSFAIIDSEVPEPRLFQGAEWTVVRRMIHTTADFDLLSLVLFHQKAVSAGVAALRSGCTIVTDTEMARAGIGKTRVEPWGCTLECHMGDAKVARRAREEGITRARAAVDQVAGRMHGEIFVIGNAPTALLRLLDYISEGVCHPALVVGMPVGFVNAEESKELLMRQAKTPYITIRGRKGGSAVAASVVNALAELALAERYPEQEKVMGKRRLRHGYTTGSAATAAAKAALLSLLSKKAHKGKVNIPLPEEGRLLIPVERVDLSDGYARATVIKDGGDDPDATHRARITSTVHLMPEEEPDRVVIEGGKGVGRVTKPGLPIPPGEPAINPGPRRQLRKAVKECFSGTGVEETGVEITIEVADGEKIARRTLNPRLGIVDGISILGTRGTVIPFSHEAYEETITLSLDVAQALGLTTVAFSTGGKSEKFLRRLFPEFPEECFIQVADFFAFALKEGAGRGFERVIYGCFFGKLIKVAQGHEYTHAKTALIDFRLLADWCESGGIEGRKAREVLGANTARHVLDMISDNEHKRDVVQLLLRKALLNGTRFVPQEVVLEVCVFAFDGTLLGTLSSTGVSVTGESGVPSGGHG